ncbi:MAG TPA: N-acetylmuramoyl-L-alanine amidase [Flavitalea sp.]|nr:N-acetylmuramoyl-L-alanine amidase [Flavitalea sp.]
MSMLILFKMTVCSGVLFGYYYLFLRNKKFHFYNRFYLLATASLSLIVPFIKIPVFFRPDDTAAHFLFNSVGFISVNSREEEMLTGINSDSVTNLFSFQNIWYLIYLTGFVFLLYFLIRSLVYIQGISKKYSFQFVHRLKFYNTTEPGTPFSFFRSIFWNNKLDVDSAEGQQIFRHEVFHVKQLHSADILFLECISIICWINPFFHLIKKELKAIHEFLADEHAISTSNELDYAELLLLRSIELKNESLTHSFFHNNIKRRIAMITKFKTKKYSYWTRLMVLPLSLLLFCVLAMYAQHGTTLAVTTVSPVGQIPPESVILLVDAGHGGSDAGAKSAKGLEEKYVTLAIARQIKKHAAFYNIHVEMTRDEDSYPTIQERTDMATIVKADLMVSIHLAAAPSIKSEDGLKNSPKGGFDLYVTNNNQQTMLQSKVLGNEIANAIRNFYAVGPIRQRKEGGIWLLDKVNCPGVIVECGYITNEKDVAFIMKAENQEKIANSILEGILRYRNLIGSGSVKDLPTTDRPSDMEVVTTIPNNKAVIKDTVPFTKVEYEPEFPGGLQAWKKYIRNNLHYPKEAIAKKKAGTVVVQFIVDTSGNISGIKAIEGPAEFRRESERIIKQSGKWMAARQGNQKVKAYYRQPISFFLPPTLKN